MDSCQHGDHVAAAHDHINEICGHLHRVAGHGRVLANAVAAAITSGDTGALEAAYGRYMAAERAGFPKLQSRTVQSAV